MPRFPLKTFQQDAILKRLSMGLVALETTNIKTLTDSELDKLQCGDVVVKKTGQQEHAYVVTYKQDKHGICLTYTDASCVETQSYDYVDEHWVYNSQDVTPLNKMESITDKDGHLRFIEGSGSVINLPQGFEVLYNKWSLSGSHLMFVLYLKNPNEDTTVATFGIKVTYDLPQWIKNKIYTPSSSYAVAFNDFIQITAGATAADKMKFAVRKDNDVISVDKYYQDTFKGGAYTRVSFDLLIDNE